MTRSTEFEQAVETMMAMARIPSLAGGWVRFEPDLSGGQWYESEAEADQRPGSRVLAELPDSSYVDDEGVHLRLYCRANLAAAIVHDVESLPVMVSAAEESLGEERADEYRGLIAQLERHLSPPALVVQLSAV